MESFVFAANSVLPLVALIFVGQLLKRVGFLNDNFLVIGNKLVFKVLLPALLFYNVYNIDNISQINLAANCIDGAKSILIGIAGNKSMQTGQAVQVDTLVKF